MSGDIEVRELRTLSVSSDGDAFRIGARDSDGNERGLVFPSECLKTLLLSLFRAGDTAFKRLLNDPTARLVYPVEDCRLQTVPKTNQLVLILRTADGFEAAFAIPPDVLVQLAEAVLERAARTKAQPLLLN